jgi:hypothetical protein
VAQDRYNLHRSPRVKELNDADVSLALSWLTNYRGHVIGIYCLRERLTDSLNVPLLSDRHSLRSSVRVRPERAGRVTRNRPFGIKNDPKLISPPHPIVANPLYEFTDGDTAGKLDERIRNATRDTHELCGRLSAHFLPEYRQTLSTRIPAVHRTSTSADQLVLLVSLDNRLRHGAERARVAAPLAI